MQMYFSQWVRNCGGFLWCASEIMQFSIFLRVYSTVSLNTYLIGKLFISFPTPRVTNGKILARTRLDTEILVKNPSPRLLGKKFWGSKQIKTSYAKTSLRDLSKTLSRFWDLAKILRSCQDFPRPTLFEVPFATPDTDASLKLLHVILELAFKLQSRLKWDCLYTTVWQ